MVVNCIVSVACVVLPTPELILCCYCIQDELNSKATMWKYSPQCHRSSSAWSSHMEQE